MNKLIEICPDFPEWPERWKGIEPDLEYGNQLLVEIRPFAEHLADSGLSKKTIKRHLTNLWLLGGEIIRDVSMHEEYSVPASEKLRESVWPEGGPICRHLYSEAEINSFDSTCRKLYKFLASMDK
jgi:hypothetical protein